MKIKEENISILMIGPLNKNNAISVSNNCQHWRANFPNSKIILSISSSDIINIDNIPESSILGISISNIRKSCDILTFCEGCTPLPPIKNDSNSLNNVNLMISSSKHGLCFVNSEYVLRIRSDAVFFNKNFIDFYEKRFLLPRSNRSILKQRVLIPQVYTLNPFSYERLPLHFGDWFHFGLVEDVKIIWDIPYMNLEDAEYYKYNDYNIISNSSERKFYTKLAVEQHVIYNAFKDKIDDLVLEYHNDIKATKISIDILLDNFIICDLNKTNFYLEKYKSSIDLEEKSTHCLNSEAWNLLCNNRNKDYRNLILEEFSKRSEEIVNSHIEYDSTFVFDAMNLNIKNGFVESKNIVSSVRSGLVSYGPYISLNSGTYEVVLCINKIFGNGICVVHCTSDFQKITLHKKYILPFRERGKVKFLLVLKEKQENIEFLIKVKNIRYLSYNKIMVNKIC